MLLRTIIAAFVFHIQSFVFPVKFITLEVEATDLEAVRICVVLLKADNVDAPGDTFLGVERPSTFR